MSPISPPSTPVYPLALAYRLKELPGFIAKYLEVPPFSQGLALYPGGRARTFTPGRHRLLSVFERLAGQGVGLFAGYLPVQPLSLRTKAANLLSGEGELLDASLIFSVEVADPVRFFTATLTPGQAFDTFPMDLESDLVFEALSRMARQYAAEDLILGLPTARLVPEVITALKPALTGLGLQLEAVQVLAFWRSTDRLLAAEKARQLDAQLQDLALEARMADLENQAQLDEFMQQLAPAQTTRIRPVVGESPAEAVKSLVVAEAEADLPAPTRLNRLARQEDPPPQKRIGFFPGEWWVPHLLVLGLILAVEAAITFVAFYFSIPPAWNERMNLLVITWGAGVGVIIKVINSLYTQGESVAEKRRLVQTTGLLGNLTSHNRARTDSLVRGQSSSELRHTEEVLQDIRKRVYAAGEERAAVAIGKLASKVKEKTADIQNPAYNPPPYLADLHLTPRLWKAYLANEEQLLAYAAAVGEQASAIQQKVSRGVSLETDLTHLEQLLDTFTHAFATRSRVIPQ